ncbi:MAG TPA: DUF1223 domain-containing protein [Paraburkholderia sp.]
MPSVANRLADPRFARALAFALALAVSGAAQAASAVCSAHSPVHRVALVELYSSEGCSSCPPADQWLSQWKDSGAAQGIVPLALHVDYWNGLGWTDRFSQRRFTERQQDLTSLGGGHTVYTPEVFVSGRELRGWSRPDSFDSRIQKVIGEPAQADVALELMPHSGLNGPGATSESGASGPKRAAAGFDVDARFRSHDAAAQGGNLNGYVAVYENTLTTQVRAGENRGATLHHERVVRQWIGPVPLVAGNAHIREGIALDALDAGAPADRFGVVAFVENAATGDVLQAAELATCR